MRLVAALLAAKLAFAVAAGIRRLIRAIFAPKALHRGPGLDQGSIHREMIVREQLLDPGLVEHRDHELHRHIAFEQPFAVLGEDRCVPDRRIHRQADKPAEQQIIVKLLHQLPLGADRIEGLKQQRPQQLLRRDGRASQLRVQTLELRRQDFQCLVHNHSYRT